MTRFYLHRLSLQDSSAIDPLRVAGALTDDLDGPVVQAAVSVVGGSTVTKVRHGSGVESAVTTGAVEAAEAVLALNPLTICHFMVGK